MSNGLPLERALDADLRATHAAMLRAARRAHELARSTGTAIVIFRNGVVQHLDAGTLNLPAQVQEPLPPYGKS